jgi:hypothetical protein
MAGRCRCDHEGNISIGRTLVVTDPREILCFCLPLVSRNRVVVVGLWTRTEMRRSLMAMFGTMDVI